MKNNRQIYENLIDTLIKTCISIKILQSREEAIDKVKPNLASLQEGTLFRVSRLEWQ